MEQSSKFKKLISGLMLGIVLLTSSATGAYALEAPQTAAPSAQVPVSPGSQDAKTTTSLGPTDQIKTDLEGKPQTDGALPMTGAVAGIDFQTFYNYCWKNLVYTTIRNTTSTSKNVHVIVYNQGSYHHIYTSVAPGSIYTYPAFYGIDGAYSAALYVWNGSSYKYDETKTGTNTCNVAVTRTVNSGGWVQLKIQNLGTAYATQVSTELAPYPGSGTYTGSHTDSPVAGGAAIYRRFQVGTQPYGIVSYTSGSFNTPRFFSGDQ